jgi:hypothetical protein
LIDCFNTVYSLLFDISFEKCHHSMPVAGVHGFPVVLLLPDD